MTHLFPLTLIASLALALSACSASPWPAQSGRAAAESQALRPAQLPTARLALAARPAMAPAQLPTARLALAAEPTLAPTAPAATAETAPTAATVEAAELTVPPPEASATAEDASVKAAARRPDRIIIDTIALNRSLVQVGLDGNSLPVVPDHDVAWYELSALPGMGENVVVWGHALRFQHAPDVPAPFERVKEARVGDTVTIVTADGSVFPYVISEQIWALPNQVGYILPMGQELLTMVNCIGDVVTTSEGRLSMTHRLITVARPAW
jgi:sortase (surface protein transpeptidase)